LSVFASIKDTALSALFPRRCPLCARLIAASERVCGDCGDSIEYINTPVCARCGLPAFECFCRDDSFVFERCVAPFIYSKSIRDGIHRLKFSGTPESAAFFGRMMAVTVKREYRDYRVNLVCPAPLHSADQSRRGYNQAALLAKSVADILEIQYEPRILIKVRATGTQHSLTREHRLQNLREAFEVTRPHVVQNRTVLLCDDVLTTGTTLSECSRALLDAGARRVLCVTAAITSHARQKGVKRGMI